MPKFIIFFSLAFSLLSLAFCGESLAKEKDGTKYLTFAKDGAWCWFQDPRAVYVAGKHKRTYSGWMTHDGQLVIGAYDHETKKIEHHVLKEKWDRDDHNTNSFLVLPNKRLMVFYARHNGRRLLCRTTSRPEDITQWEDEVVITDATRITYNHPVYLSDEKLYYVFWRGPSWKPTFATSKDGKTWSKPKILIQQPGRAGRKVRPYLKVISDGKSAIHFTFTDGHPRNEPQNSVYYLRYQNGAFYKANGTKVTGIENVPVACSDSDLVYNGKATNQSSFSWDIAIDQKNNPVIAYSRYPKLTDHRYHYARWSGKRWVDTELTPAGRWFPQTQKGKKEREPHYSGGMSINKSNPSVVYLSRQIKGTFEIEKWTSKDHGKTWTSKPITQGSSKMNIRPVVPRGYNGKGDYVLWMHGDYIHYTNFQTGIKILVPKQSSTKSE